MIATECTLDDLGEYKSAVQDTLQTLRQQRLPERIWNKDPSLWKNDPEIQKKILNRLGWLNIPEAMLTQVTGLQTFATLIKEAGFKDVVLLGMGGSSLCPEVLRLTFGVAEGYPKLTVLDTTDPASILKVAKSLDLKQTMFLLASKSGSTIEMKSLYQYFANLIRENTEDPIGDHFIAITDPDSPLADLARINQFQKVFIAPPDVGGRFSALTYFGLLPAAIIGIDVQNFLNRAIEMIKDSSAPVSIEKNRSMKLGAILGTLGLAGRDKVTLVTSESISSFGLWAEQLVAESTGKEGLGLVPIAGEDIGKLEVYGDDRLFVYLRVDADDNTLLDKKMDQLQKAGHPLVRLHLRDRLDLAGEFFRWEMATAVAAVISKVNPFDEPNVSSSKAITMKVLEEHKRTGQFEQPPTIMGTDDISFCGVLTSVSTSASTSTSPTAQSLSEVLTQFLKQSVPNDYVALMAYFECSDQHESLLQAFRLKIRNRFHLATTLGYGPRFLHSTGQLHKGGPANGLFIQLTSGDKEDINIPGLAYSFGVLKRAQALGDFKALSEKGLRVIEIRLAADIESGLRRLLSLDRV